MREAVLTTIQKRPSNAIIESASQLVIQAIMWDITTPTQISIPVEDIMILDKVVKNVKVYLL